MVYECLRLMQTCLGHPSAGGHWIGCIVARESTVRLRLQFILQSSTVGRCLSLTHTLSACSSFPPYLHVSFSLPSLLPSSPSSSSSSSGGCKRRGSDESGSVSSRQQLHGCAHSGATNVPGLQQTLLDGVIQGEEINSH